MDTTLFFDLGNVLIFFSFEKMFDQLHQVTQIPLLKLQKHVKEKLPAFEMGRLKSTEFYDSLCQLTSHSFNYEQMALALSDIFTPNYEVWTIVEELKKKGHRLVLISNTNECHFNFALSHYKVLQLFDRFILSYEVGAAKPEALIFKEALKESTGKTFYTDDILAFVTAGKKAGLDAELFKDASSLKQQLKERSIY